MIVEHKVGSSIDLIVPHLDTPLWRYQYGDTPKPFFHPVLTPAGHCVTLLSPHDHIWHRGIWFTIKFINGENFWEEKEKGEFGTQVTLQPPDILHESDGAVCISSRQEWRRPGDAGVVFDEQRLLTYRPFAPDAYAIDWSVSLAARDNLLLDRTVYTTWGGYSGLAVRGNRNWQDTKLLFADGSMTDRPTGWPGPLCDLSGTFDGGRNQEGGIAVFDHPDNVRHPSPWYGNTGSGHFFNAAFLFHEPMTLKKTQKLTLKYRTLIHDGRWGAARLHEAYRDYAHLREDV